MMIDSHPSGQPPVYDKILTAKEIIAKIPSEQPPVYSKPKDSQTQAQATPYPTQGASYYPQGQVLKDKDCYLSIHRDGNADLLTLMPLFRFRCNTLEQASPLSTLGPLQPTLPSTHRHCRNLKPSTHPISFLFQGTPTFPSAYPVAYQQTKGYNKAFTPTGALYVIMNTKLVH